MNSKDNKLNKQENNQKFIVLLRPLFEKHF